MDNIQKSLLALFDFQRFARDPGLDGVIRAVGVPGGAAELTDDELELNAAGEPEARRFLPGDGEKPWAR